MTADSHLIDAQEMIGTDPGERFGFGAEARDAIADVPFAPDGTDPSLSYRRSGTLRYLLYDRVRELSIDSTGDIPQRNWQDNGDENFWRSMLYYNEFAGHSDLPANQPIAPGEIWEFSGPHSISWEVHSAVVAGGEIRDQGPTSANADFRITSSNTFVMASGDDPRLHHLFYGCPGESLQAGVVPNAKRSRASGKIRCIRESNNETLHAFDIPDYLWNNREIQIVPIERILVDLKKQLGGETIRIEYYVTSFGASEGRADPQWIVVGASTALAVLPMVRRR